MAAVSGTNLQNVSDVIDAIRNELTTSHNWTEVINIGNVGANTKEVWISLAAANTKNGMGMLVGMRVYNDNVMQLTMSHLSAADAGLTSSPRNSFLRVLGTPGTSTVPPGNAGDTYLGVVLGGNTDGTPAAANLFDQGANYLNHFILTPDQVSPQGTTEQYCYCFVEVASGVWRTIGFGEGIKLGGGAWTGGLFVEGSWHLEGASYVSADIFGSFGVNHHFPFGGGYRYHSSTDSANDAQRRGGYIYSDQNYVYLNDSPQFWNPWIYSGNRNSFDDSNIGGCTGYDPRAFGMGILRQSPSAFSGLTQRVPARMYEIQAEPGTAMNIVPLIEYPDVFHVNLRDFAPGSVVVDDGEKFLVVPYTAKSGTYVSSNYGIMVRNPSLTV